MTNEDKFNIIYKKYKKGIKFWINIFTYKNNISEEDREDIFQKICLSIFKNIDSYTLDNKYLTNILKIKTKQDIQEYITSKFCKKNRPFFLKEDEDINLNYVENEYIKEIENEYLNFYLDKLKTIRKEYIKEYFGIGTPSKTYDEIGIIYGKSLESIRQQVLIGLQELNKLIKK